MKGYPVKEIRNLIDKEKNGEKKIIFVFSIVDSKTSIAVGVSYDLVDQYDAANIVKNIVTSLGGKGGGGRKDFAQTGSGILTTDKIYKIVSEFIKTIN